MKAKKVIYLSAVLAAILTANGCSTTRHSEGISLHQIARYETGIFDKSAAEIVAFDSKNQSYYVVNGATRAVDTLKLKGRDALHMAESAEFIRTGSLILTAQESPTSVAVHQGTVAVAVHDADAPGRPGKIVFFDETGRRIREVESGNLPDMVTFTPDGRFALSANEGEPDDIMDPPGSITIIDLRNGLGQASARQIDFSRFSLDEARSKGIRLFPGKVPANDFEPEYIAVSPDSSTAWVSLQEANAIAKIDLASANLIDVIPLGTKNHGASGAGLDPFERDGAAKIGPVPVKGLYMPDALAAFETEGSTYVITANEGDARAEDERVQEAPLDDAIRKKVAEIPDLKRLKISTIDGDTDGDGDIDELHSFGARSFSIWSANGTLVYDSGDAFERITSQALGANFNATNDANKGENRSDDKGPEPEGVVIGTVEGRIYAFIGLERVGGIIIYDVTSPKRASFVAYHNNRDFSAGLDFYNAADLSKAGDLGPEGLAFVPQDQNPFGVPLLIVASEVSGTVTAYAVSVKGSLNRRTASAP